MADPTGFGHVHPLKLFDVAKKERRFLYTSAPMVRYSKLAFRHTVFAYGTDLCWTPMILAKEFNRNKFARDSDFTVSTEGPQPPTIVQFGANSPLELARASSLVAPFSSGVDLNCGCPQSWACAETMGAALMERRELVRNMVVETREHLRRDGWAVGKDKDMDSPRGRSVSVKIRVHKDLRKTMDFITTVLGPEHDRHVDFLTIHPRTRSTPSSTPINVEALSLLTSTFGDRVPILVSGDVFALSALPFASPYSTFTSSATTDTTTTPLLNVPKLAGLMSARALLANPALYAGHDACPWSAVEAFMRYAARCPLPLKLVQHHVGEMCGPGMGPNKRALLGRAGRSAMLACANMVDLVDFLDEKRKAAAIREADGGAGATAVVQGLGRRDEPGHVSRIGSLVR
ncbi:dihydrouridine synthase [Lasiosphaeria miniovina]|uniref:Dihydrouridine synthase n=1 Tax=Lasiosphaeria miniovina TaxID=1954250 RepID=A0AA40BHK9_9PEZI|nr:dihydrouridine synthase [Lasiosphaeria miniovina]KAK0734394.1 dihydrouridine synthase [Lasiosphaeria miniovina]